MKVKKLFALYIYSIVTFSVYAHVPLLDSNRSSLAQLQENKCVKNHSSIRLHLGCGEQHLKGYINIDFPLSEHTIQTQSGADVFADITTLNFPAQSIHEVRSHHFFEHFDRQTAIAMLCRWHEWLAVGGKLYIETPDFEECAKAFLSGSYQQKQRIIRHIFGSHEAFWALHYDGWFQEKYERFLKKMGFSDIQFNKGRYFDTYNIHVTAIKKRHLNKDELHNLAAELLREYCINASACEGKIHTVWLKEYENATKKMSCKNN